MTQLTGSLAVMEFKMALATFIWHFDARLKELGQPPPSSEDSFVMRKGPFEIIISPVNQGAVNED